MNTVSAETETAINSLVHDFYTAVRADSVLGPIFNHHVQDWEAHHQLLVNFWSNVLTGSQRYAGSPMMKHAVLPDIHEHHFQHWLSLFKQTCDQQSNQELASKAYEAALRIAQSLWYGYQIRQDENSIPSKLNLV